MQKAARKIEDQPGSVARDAGATGHEGMADWAGLAYGAGDEEFHLEQEQDAEIPEVLPGDWGQDPQFEMGAGAAEVDAGSPPDEAEIVRERAPFEYEAPGGDGEPVGQVWAVTPDRPPFFEHALYIEAMHALAAGNGTAVASSLRELAELYPDEPVVRDLLVRMELKSAVAQEREPPVDRGRAAPALQGALAFLLLLAIGLAVVAGFYLAFKNIVEPVWQERQSAAELRELNAQISSRLARGDLTGAREKLLELQTLQRGDGAIAEQIAQIDRQIQLSNLYADALGAQEAGDVAGALALLQGIEAQEPGYRDVQQRIGNLQLLLVLEADWLEAEARVGAEDWQAALAFLFDIRRRDPEYRKEQVKERLFQIYERLAWQSLNQAEGNAERLRDALGYLDGALRERPTNRDLARQRALALAYVSGSDAQARGDWLQAAEQWEKAYAQDPGYQSGALQARLKAAYPLAARQAVAQANGSIERLEQAAAYMDRALRDAPGDEGLRQELALVMAYLDGARAFKAGYWDQAIRHWGPLYAAQPGFQNGALERNLRQACGASPDPDLALCPP
jgi:hypothetical protein